MKRELRDVLAGSGGRRFMMAMGAGMTTTVLQWFGKIDPAGNTYAMVIIATVAAYITGNTAQKRFESDKLEPKE